MSGSNYNYLASPAVAAPDFYLRSIQGLQAYRDQQAQLATSQAYQQSIDPQTGALNQGKFNALLASTPQGAWNIGPAMQQAGQAQTAQGVGTQQQVQAKMSQMQGISAYMTPLIQKVQQGQPVSGQEVLGAASQAAAAGFVTPEMQANVQKQVASIGPNGDATNIVRGAFFATQAGQEQLKTLYPPTQAVNLGATVQPYQPSPLAVGGAGFTGGGVGGTTTMSPGDAAQPVTIEVGNGQQITTTKGVAAGILANNPNLQRLNPGFNAGGGGPGGQVTNQSFGPNQGRYTPPQPQGGGGNAPPSGPYVVGDSIGQGIRTAGKFDGNTTVGASPQAVLATINDPKNPLPVQGRDVVLANGSNPGNLTMVQDQIAALQKQGAKSVTVVGVANPQIDQQLQQYAAAAGARYVPLGAVGPDGVHPTGYGGLATAVGAPAAPPAAPSWARPPPPLPQGGSAGGIGLTPAPGYVEAQRTTAAASTQAANTLQAQVGASKDIEPILADMQTQLGTKGFSTGVGSIVMNTTRQLMQRVGLVPEEPAPGVDLTSPQAAQELFAKDAARLQAAQLGALGNPTDARQELSETTNPGLMLSKYGNLGILRMLAGNQQAIRIQGDAWATAQQQGWTPDRFNEWLNNHFLQADPKTGGRFDPRVQWFANEPSLQEQRNYFAKIPKGQQEQFLSNLQYAKNLGWIGQSSTGLTMPGGP